MVSLFGRKALFSAYFLGAALTLFSCHGVVGTGLGTADAITVSVAWDAPVDGARVSARGVSQVGGSATLLASLYDGAALLEEKAIALSDGATQAAVSFSSIPIGVRLTFSASVYAANGLSLYEGSSSFTVGQSGLTQAILSMRRSPIVVAVVSSGDAYISNDASAWLGPYPTGLSVVRSVGYANGRFIAVGDDGATNGLASSAMGQAWVKQNLDATARSLNWVSAAPDGSVMIRGVDTGITNKFFHSSDGVSWSGPVDFTMITVGPIWFNGEWIITSSNASGTRRSSDGVNWSSAVSAGGLYQVNALIGYGDKIIAGGGAPTNVSKQVNVWNSAITSFSGEINIPGTTHYINAFALDPTRNRLLAVGSGSGAQAAYSDTQGSSWTVATGTGTKVMKAAAIWKGGFLIGDTDGQIYRSANGASFSPAGAALGAEIGGIAYNGAP